MAVATHPRRATGVLNGRHQRRRVQERGMRTHLFFLVTPLRGARVVALCEARAGLMVSSDTDGSLKVLVSCENS